MKTFISAIPLQRPETLYRTHYNAGDNDFLKYEGETSFPILIPMLKCEKEKDEKIRVIVIITDGAGYVPVNYELFKKELEEISQTPEREFEYEIVEIHTDYNETIEKQLKLFGDIVALIGDNEKLYCCISYGMKSVPMLMTMSMNYGYKLKRNTSVECVVYGKYDFNKHESCIYDVSALFFMGSIVEKLSEMHIENPYAMLKELLEG